MNRCTLSENLLSKVYYNSMESVVDIVIESMSIAMLDSV